MYDGRMDAVCRNGGCCCGPHQTARKDKPGICGFSVIGGCIAGSRSRPGVGRLDAEWIQILLKTLGICLLCQITASVCRDAGENSLAFGVETVCRFTVLVEALPLLRELLDAVVHLLEGSL